MAVDQDFTIKDLVVHDGPAYDAHGQLVRVRIVSFMIGKYGPFGLTGLASELTTDEIMRRIRAEREGIRQLTAEVG